MAKDDAQTWINFTADDLPKEQLELFRAMQDAKARFEASFPVPEGKALRFSYKGERMGMCVIDAPKTREKVATNLSAWIAAQRAANLKH